MLNRLNELALECGFEVVDDVYEGGDTADVFGYLLWFRQVEEPAMRVVEAGLTAALRSA